ncbi:MAG: small multi-drug export protein, partial [Oscillospiraceae bacterium]|nr:small multi-drug export protein [Oscillospiraceae bacterium]
MNKLIKDYFWVFFISMLPIVELRGAIPVGVGMGLPFITTYLVAAFGNMIPVPFILWLVKPVLQ